MQERFQLLAAHPSLDFANTLDNRYSPSGPLELLDSYADIVQFASECQLLSASQARSVLRNIRPTDAENALKVARELREAIERIFSAIADGRKVPVRDLAILNNHIEQALAHRQIEMRNGSFAWTWSGIETLAQGLLWPISHAAGELLAAPDLNFVRRCDASTCRWLFLDTSKNHSRKWCDMKICGNRQKARLHYKRRQSALRTT